MKKVVLIGASGFVGSAVLKELLDRKHHVKAIMRDTTKITVEHQNLVVKQANVLHQEEVEAAVKGHDVVISAYNPGWTNPNLYQEFLQGAKTIQEGIKKAAVPRLIVVGGAGSLFVEGKQVVESPDFPEDWKAGALAARDYLNILKEEEQLDWTFLSPAIEMHQGTSGERKGRYRTGLDSPVFDDAGRSIISVEDLALAIVDEVENSNYIRKRFTVAY